MQCPFLKKINFKKVNQITTEQIVAEETAFEPISESKTTISCDEDFSIPEEAIENTHTSSFHKHNFSHFSKSNKLNTPESSNYKLEIKYPKQLETKHMLNRLSNFTYDKQNIETQEMYSFEQEMSEIKNIPQALISKSSMMNFTNKQLFYGEVVLLDEPQNLYQCSIKNAQIKIFNQNKVKYFINLCKVECEIVKYQDKILKINAECKNSKISIKIGFSCPKKADTFLQVFQSSCQKSKASNQQVSKRDPEQVLNLNYSLDSLGFQVQRIGFAKLRQICDTFDIILFKNKSMMSKMQRFFTNSDYDHVAMILRTNSNEIFLFESSSNCGVIVYSLDSLIGLPKSKYYFRIALRKYQAERKITQILKLQQFIRQSIGKRYKFDPMYLISSTVEKGDTYFCSELVAEALIKTNILNSSKPAYKYLPKHFAADDLNENIVGTGSFSDIIILEE